MHHYPNIQQMWSELLCCIKCKNVFSDSNLPINLGCGHLMCEKCISANPLLCPFDKNDISKTKSLHYVNGPVYSILAGQKDPKCLKKTLRSFSNEADAKYLEEVEAQFYHLAGYLYKIKSEKGATVTSNRLSRTVQRKLLTCICTNVLVKGGCAQLTQLVRSMVERIVSELILNIQNNSNLSSLLWSAVRGRGCQFLGPAIQEEVLKLIHHVMKHGESLARKNLVIYVVNTLTEQYPHISKTSIGHVVQLLYRASCFNVIKQDGQSSLMQLKEEFRNYDGLRAEHDAQIVQIAMEAGLRISPDQWSSLLYGDCKHRKHMESVCSRLNNDSLKNCVGELHKLADQQPPERDLFGLQTTFEHFDAIVEIIGGECSNSENGLAKIATLLEHTNSVLAVYSKFIINRHAERENRQVTCSGYDIVPKENYPPHQNSHGRNTPMRRSNAMNIPPPGMGFQRPKPLMKFSQPQPPNLSNYYADTSMAMSLFGPAMGSPPNFMTHAMPPPLNVSPPGDRRDSGTETIPTTLMTVLPATTTTPILQPNPSTSPTMYGSGIIFLGNNASPSDHVFPNPTTFIAPNPATATTILSTSPPTYQFSPGGLISGPGPTQYMLPIQSPQSQSIILYGSTPPQTFAFGSPPILCPQWVTPLEAAAFNAPAPPSLFYLQKNLNSEGSSNQGHRVETSYESDEEHLEDHGKEGRHPTRGEEDDNAECHVSFTVATSVLHEDRLGSSVGSWALELPSNVSIPLSPAQTLKYTSAKSPSLCTVIQAMSASSISSLLGGGTPLTVPTLHELKNTSSPKVVNITLSS